MLSELRKTLENTNQVSNLVPYRCGGQVIKNQRDSDTGEEGEVIDEDMIDAEIAKLERALRSTTPLCNSCSIS